MKNRKGRRLGYPKEIVHAILDRDTIKERKVLATIIDRKGSAPRGIGTKMLVLPDGVCVGTIGGRMCGSGYPAEGIIDDPE